MNRLRMLITTTLLAFMMANATGCAVWARNVLPYVTPIQSAQNDSRRVQGAWEQFLTPLLDRMQTAMLEEVRSIILEEMELKGWVRLESLQEDIAELEGE